MNDFNTSEEIIVSDFFHVIILFFHSILLLIWLCTWPTTRYLIVGHALYHVIFRK